MTIDLDVLEGLAKAATSGEWTEREDENEHYKLLSANCYADGSSKPGDTLNGGIFVVETKGPDCKANAAFIAAARPAAVQALIALARERDGLREALTNVTMWMGALEETYGEFKGGPRQALLEARQALEAK